jgi:hypothetical protein
MPKSPPRRSRSTRTSYQRALPAPPKTCLPDVIGCLNVPGYVGLCSLPFCQDMPSDLFGHVIASLIERLERLAPEWGRAARSEWHNIALSWNLEARYLRNNDELDWRPPTGEYARWIDHVKKQLENNTRRVGKPHGTARLSCETPHRETPPRPPANAPARRRARARCHPPAAHPAARGRRHRVRDRPERPPHRR